MKHTEQFHHIQILLEKIWCQHQDNRIEVTMVTVTLRSQTSHLQGDTWSDLVWYYIMKKIFKRNMKNNHQNRCKNKKFNIQKQKTHILHLGASFLFVDFRSENIDYAEDHPMNILTHWSNKVNGQRRLWRLVQTGKWWVRLAKNIS